MLKAGSTDSSKLLRLTSTISPVPSCLGKPAGPPGSAASPVAKEIAASLFFPAARCLYLPYRRNSRRASRGPCRPHHRRAPRPSREVRARSSYPEFGRPQVFSPRQLLKRDGFAIRGQKRQREDLSCTSGAAIPAKPIQAAGESTLPLLRAPIVGGKSLHSPKRATNGSVRELRRP